MSLCQTNRDGIAVMSQGGLKYGLFAGESARPMSRCKPSFWKDCAESSAR